MGDGGDGGGLVKRGVLGLHPLCKACADQGTMATSRCAALPLPKLRLTQSVRAILKGQTLFYPQSRAPFKRGGGSAEF